MKQHVFCYGTLLIRKIRWQLFRKHISTVNAELPHMQAYQVTGECFPVAKPKKGKVLQGTLLTLNTKQLNKLDRYEGRMYRRVLCRVRLPDGQTSLAFIYRPKEQLRISRREWNIEHFQRRYLRTYLGHMV